MKVIRKKLRKVKKMKVEIKLKEVEADQSRTAAVVGDPSSSINTNIM